MLKYYASVGDIGIGDWIRLTECDCDKCTKSLDSVFRVMRINHNPGYSSMDFECDWYVQDKASQEYKFVSRTSLSYKDHRKYVKLPTEEQAMLALISLSS